MAGDFREGRSKIDNEDEGENEHDGATFCKAIIANSESASLNLTATNDSVSLEVLTFRRP
jgi:hypothetical protein